MFSVVNKPFGTAFGSRTSRPIFAGKTGTVQVRTISENERELGIIPNKDLPFNQRDHALFLGFAPYKNPKIAVSVVIEHGGSGSKIAAPIAKKISRVTTPLRPIARAIFTIRSIRVSSYCSKLHCKELATKRSSGFATQSGSRGSLTLSPHNTLHADPHRAFH